MVNVLRRDDDLRLLVVFRLSRRVNFTPPGNKEEKTLNLFLFLYVILVLRARRLPTFGRARREVLFRDFCLEASRASSSFVVVVVRCLRVKKVSEGRFDDASGVRKVNKTLALKAVSLWNTKSINTRGA